MTQTAMPGLPDDELPAPLRGCLYCHSEGATRLTEGRKIFGLGSGLPMITCQHCGSVALFQAGPPSDPGAWRIRYKKVNRAPRYYYAMTTLGSAGWLDADEALAISRNGYVQRQRVLQAQRGDLSWLEPAPLDPPPPLMSPDELVFLSLDPVTLQQAGRGGGLAQDDQTVLDSGRFYLTDRKIHLLGHRRDWSHRLSDIQTVEHTDQYWRIYLSSGSQHYQGANHPDQIDAQLFTAILKALLTLRETP